MSATQLQACVCMNPGDRSKERGLWESEGPAALDTWRHVRPRFQHSVQVRSIFCQNQSACCQSTQATPEVSECCQGLFKAKWWVLHFPAKGFLDVVALEGFKKCPVSIWKCPNEVVGICWLYWSVTVMFCDCQTARRVGEWERQTSAEDEGRPPVQAAHRHSRAAGPQHLQVRMWS